MDPSSQAKEIPGKTGWFSFNGSGIRSVALNLGTCDPYCNLDVVSALAVQGDGKLALAGAASDDAIIAQPMLGRLKVDGSFDTSFHGTGLFSVGTSWPGHGGMWPAGIAERPDTRELVVTMSYRVSSAAGSPTRQLLTQWSSNGNTLRASRSFEFTAHASQIPEAIPQGLLVDSDSAMMVGSRRWDASDWSNRDHDITLVRTLVDMDFLFSDGFE